MNTVGKYSTRTKNPDGHMGTSANNKLKYLSNEDNLEATQETMVT